MKKLLTLSLLAFACTSVAAPPPAISNTHRFTIGDIGASESFAGAIYITDASGASFPGCSVAPTQVWAGSNDNTTPSGIKAMYAGLLTAKATGGEVTAWYAPDAGGICRIQVLTIH